MNAAEHLAELVAFFESLTPETLAELPRFYDDHAVFIDPFNKVVGHAAIRRIFSDMFEKLTAPRFVVTGCYVAAGDTPADEAMLRWELRFESRLLGKGESIIEGSTHLKFGADGRVILHRDHWDAARELLARIPLLGLPIRGLTRLFRAS